MSQNCHKKAPNSLLNRPYDCVYSPAVWKRGTHRADTFLRHNIRQNINPWQVPHPDFDFFRYFDFQIQTFSCYFDLISLFLEKITQTIVKTKNCNGCDWKFDNRVSKYYAFQKQTFSIQKARSLRLCKSLSWPSIFGTCISFLYVRTWFNWIFSVPSSYGAKLY